MKMSSVEEMLVFDEMNGWVNAGERLALIGVDKKWSRRDMAIVETLDILMTDSLLHYPFLS